MATVELVMTMRFTVLPILCADLRMPRLPFTEAETRSDSSWSFEGAEPSSLTARRGAAAWMMKSTPSTAASYASAAVMSGTSTNISWGAGGGGGAAGGAARAGAGGAGGR